jgi:hypothetical protein
VDGVLGHARGLPHDVSGRPVVAADLARGACDDLGPARVLDDERRRPRGLLVALLTPQLPTGLPVESDDERVALVVPLDEQPVPIEGGRAALPEGQLDRHVAEVLLPEDLAVRVQRVEAARAEVGEDHLAVGGRRGGGPGGGRVRALVGQLVADDPLPEDLPVAAPEGQDRELLRGVGGRAEAGAASGRRRLGGRGRDGGCALVARHRGQDVEAIAPHDRGRGALARDRHLPADVLRLAPLDGGPGVGRHPRHGRPAPLRPVALSVRVGAVRAGRGQGQDERHEGENEPGLVQANLLGERVHGA